MKRKSVERKNALIILIIIVLVLIAFFVFFKIPLTGNAIYSSYCSDTDGGQDFFVKGIVSTSTPDKDYFNNYTDSCRSNTSVMEYYCLKNNSARPSINITNCQYGCFNGVCVKPTINYSLYDDVYLTMNFTLNSTNIPSPLYWNVSGPNQSITLPAYTLGTIAGSNPKYVNGEWYWFVDYLNANTSIVIARVWTNEKYIERISQLAEPIFFDSLNETNKTTALAEAKALNRRYYLWWDRRIPDFSTSAELENYVNIRWNMMKNGLLAQTALYGKYGILVDQGTQDAVAQYQSIWAQDEMNLPWYKDIPTLTATPLRLSLISEGVGGISSQVTISGNIVGRIYARTDNANVLIQSINQITHQINLYVGAGITKANVMVTDDAGNHVSVPIIVGSNQRDIITASVIAPITGYVVGGPSDCSKPPAGYEGGNPLNYYVGNKEENILSPLQKIIPVEKSSSFRESVIYKRYRWMLAQKDANGNPLCQEILYNSEEKHYWRSVVAVSGIYQETEPRTGEPIGPAVKTITYDAIVWMTFSDTFDYLFVYNENKNALISIYRIQDFSECKEAEVNVHVDCKESNHWKSPGGFYKTIDTPVFYRELRHHQVEGLISAADWKSNHPEPPWSAVGCASYNPVGSDEERDSTQECRAKILYPMYYRDPVTGGIYENDGYITSDVTSIIYPVPGPCHSKCTVYV